MESDGKAEAIAEAQTLLRRGRFGVLCTLSRRMEGWPFGSVAPYALDSSGAPVLLIATIAEHTKNVAHDDRVSLLVHDEASSDDIQAHGRITVMGRMKPIPAPDIEDASARYLARLPSAESYFQSHDFVFHRIAAEKVRFIGGFGRIFWLEASDLSSPDGFAASRAGIISHMNADHADALVLLCKAHAGISPEKAEMVGVDEWGLDVMCHSPDRRVRINFPARATHKTIRPVVVELVKAARAQG